MTSQMFGSAVAGITRAALLGGFGARAQPPKTAQDFVAAAAGSDQYEIAAGRLILTQSADPRARAFAKEMIDAHTGTTAALKAAAAAVGLPPPPEGLGGDQQKMLAGLQSLKDADLDRTYVVQQVNAHAATLVTEQTCAAAGTDPNLRTAAQAAVPLIESHLQMAKALKQSESGT